MDSKTERARADTDPFVRAVRSIAMSEESKFFLEWLVRNYAEAARDAAASSSAEDMLKISGRLYEYDFIIRSVSDALEQANCGEIELFVSDSLYGRVKFARKTIWRKFLNLFRLRGTGS